MSTGTPALLLVAAVLLVGCDAAAGDEPARTPDVTAEYVTVAPQEDTEPEATAEEPQDTAEPVAGDAMEALDGLRVVAHDIQPYDREADFGGRWTDTDGNGCTTRQDVMLRDSTEWVDEDGDCQPEQVVIQDRYTGAAYVTLDVSQAHTEHVVSVHEAWLTGAQDWDQETREAFYQDPLNLITVEGTVNMAKGDANAAQWLPPYQGGHCEFAAHQVTVKAKYDLGVTGAEYAALSGILADCPGQELLTGTTVPVFDTTTYLTGGSTVPTEDVNPAPAVEDEPGGTGDDGVHFENCAAAREAGAAPLHEGQPGYRPGMDGDGDGVACE